MRIKFVTICIVTSSVTLFSTASASAQNLQVQQPVVEIFTVDSAVSVPDRGSTFLGGVSNAREGSTMYGPVPYGTSSGRSLSNSSTRTHVYIHDFAWLDQQLLLEGEQKYGILQPFAGKTTRERSASQVLRSDHSSGAPFVPALQKQPSISDNPTPQIRRQHALDILRQTR